MKKRILLLIVSIGFCFLFKLDVKAVIILKDDVKPNTYIIGKYMFTRDANSDFNYDGVLTTEKIMLASTTIDSSKDEVIVYRKNLLGVWVNGLTGETIDTPDYFEIENRNLHDLLETPNLSCNFLVEDDVTCHTYIINNHEAIEPNDENASIKFNNEYYKLLNENGDGELFAQNVNGVFKDFDGNTLQIVKINENELDGADNLAIVSRIYYEDTALDGTKEKVYSNYSNIMTNGFEQSDIPVEDLPNLVAKIVPVGVEVSKKNPYDVKYYNVEFSLDGLDVSKYKIINYKIFSNSNEDNIGDYLADIQNASNASAAHEYLWTDNLVSEKYFDPYYIENFGYGYLATEVDGYNMLMEYEDVSNQKSHSIRFDNNDDTIEYVAQVTICRVNDDICYDTFIPSKVTAGQTYNISFEYEDGTNIETQYVKENNKILAPENPTKEGYVFTKWTLNNNDYDFNTPVTGDLVLVANFRLLYNYEVVFNTNGGSNISNQIVIEGNKVIEPSAPTKTGHVFDKWLYNNEDFDFNTIIASGITLDAKWIQNEFVVRIERVDDYSPDYILRVYEEGQQISFNKIIANGYDLCLGSLPIVNTNELNDINELTIVLNDGTNVAGVLEN